VRGREATETVRGKNHRTANARHRIRDGLRPRVELRRVPVVLLNAS